MEVIFSYEQGGHVTIRPVSQRRHGKVIAFNLNSKKIAIFSNDTEANQIFFSGPDSIYIYDQRGQQVRDENGLTKYRIEIDDDKPVYYVDSGKNTWYFCSEVDGYILLEDHRERVFYELTKYKTLYHRYKVKPILSCKYYIIPDWNVFRRNETPDETSDDETPDETSDETSDDKTSDETSTVDSEIADDNC